MIKISKRPLWSKNDCYVIYGKFYLKTYSILQKGGPMGIIICSLFHRFHFTYCLYDGCHTEKEISEIFFSYRQLKKHLLIE